MPLALEPGKKLPIVLDSDMHMPLESRPTFFFPSVSNRKYTELQEAIDDCWNHPTATDICKAVCEMLKKHCQGWKNMGEFEFGVADFMDLLTNQEAQQLLRKYLANQHVTTEEKKSSE